MITTNVNTYRARFGAFGSFLCFRLRPLTTSPCGGVYVDISLSYRILSLAAISSNLIFSFALISYKFTNTVLDSRRKEGNVLFNDTLNTFYLQLYGVTDIWLRTIQIAREEICCRHIGYSLRLTARVLLYATSHRQDSTYHGLLHQTSHAALAGMRNSSMGSPHEESIRQPIAPWASALTTELHLPPSSPINQCNSICGCFKKTHFNSNDLTSDWITDLLFIFYFF